MIIKPFFAGEKAMKAGGEKNYLPTRFEINANNLKLACLDAFTIFHWSNCDFNKFIVQLVIVEPIKWPTFNVKKK